MANLGGERNLAAELQEQIARQLKFQPAFPEHYFWPTVEILSTVSVEKGSRPSSLRHNPPDWQISRVLHLFVRRCRRAHNLIETCASFCLAYILARFIILQVPRGNLFERLGETLV